MAAFVDCQKIVKKCGNEKNGIFDGISKMAF